MRWISNPLDSPKARLLENALRGAGLNLSSATAPVLADLLVRRGIDEPEAAARFLSPSLEDLHDPLQMSGMRGALDRLEAALERKEKILVYGDYDVDGTTAIVILKTAIELCGGAADFHVPHRIREGYGMRDEVIERAAADGVRLIISVDTGIRAFAAAETARRTGVDLIVTDHHLPGMDGVPQALVVINPNQEGCDYPCKFLCGAGVAFKLAQGLMQRRLEAKDHNRLLLSFMKVVAIATIADSVPLLGENRVFAKLGLQGLRRPVNVGLKTLRDAWTWLEMWSTSSTKRMSNVRARPPDAWIVSMPIVRKKNGASWKTSGGVWKKSLRFERPIASSSMAKVGIAASSVSPRREWSRSMDGRR